MTRPGRMTVTPDGHSLAVWESALREARRTSLSRLITAAAPDAARWPLGLVLASAHPDDETLGGGRLAHAWSENIGPVFGVLSTLGEACVDHVMARPHQLAERRLAEWRLATTRLGFTDGQVLGLPDGGLSAALPALVDGLRAVVNHRRDDYDLVLAAPWRGDPHPDHQAVGRAAALLADELDLPMVEYPVWMTYWSTPAALHAAHQELVIMESDPAAEAAHQHATQAFVTQIQPLTPYATPVVPAAMLEHQRQQLIIVPPDDADRLCP